MWPPFCGYVFEGSAQIAGRAVRDGQLPVLGGGDGVHLGSETGARLPRLAGVPLRKPVAQYGPFVMNNETSSSRQCVTTRPGGWARSRVSVAAAWHVLSEPWRIQLLAREGGL